MNNLLIAPGPLVEILKVLTQGLLTKNLITNIQNFAKIDYNLVEGDEHFLVQITKCGIGCSDLKLRILLDNALSNHVDCKNLRETIIAVVEKKSVNRINIKKALYTSQSSLVLRTVKIDPTQKDFCVFKSYTSIKFLFRLNKCDLQEFSSLLQAYLKHTMDVYSKVKFVYRNDIQYFYRNLVPMDDILLSCDLVTSSLLSMFRNSRKNNPEYYENLKKVLGIKKSGTFEKTVTCVLVSMADDVFTNSQSF